MVINLVPVDLVSPWCTIQACNSYFIPQNSCQAQREMQYIFPLNGLYDAVCVLILLLFSCHAVGREV